MDKTIYDVRVGEDVRFSFAADLAEASAPICYVGADGNLVSTPFQTANARHCEVRAAELLIEHSGINGGELVGEDEDWTVEAR